MQKWAVLCTVQFSVLLKLKLLDFLSDYMLKRNQRVFPNFGCVLKEIEYSRTMAVFQTIEMFALTLVRGTVPLV